jgi:AraC-like DNA-binding protein
MIVDLYSVAKNEPSYNKLVGRNYLIVEYKCPIDTEKFQLLTESHFLIYVISGRKDFISSNKTYESKAGDALFLRSGVYTTRQYFDEDNCVLLFFMNDDFIQNFMLENGSVIPANNETTQDQIFRLDVDDVLKSLFHSVYNYLKMGTEIPKNLVEIKFKELLFSVVLNPKNMHLAKFFNSLNQTSKTSLDHVMTENFQHDLQLEEFARLSGRSLSAFKRDFKNFYNQPPGKWLRDKRLAYAKTLLLSSDLNVNQICYESGFKNSTHFNKAFKDKYRLPPKQFQAQSKNA